MNKETSQRGIKESIFDFAALKNKEKRGKEAPDRNPAMRAGT